MITILISLTVVFGYVYLMLFQYFKPDTKVLPTDLANISQWSSLVGPNLISILIACLGYAFLHEYSHAGMFYIFKRKMPEEVKAWILDRVPQFPWFKFNNGYIAFPNDRLNKFQFMSTLLTPLIFISIFLGLVFIYVIPSALVLPLFFLLIVNAASCAGDCCEAYWAYGRNPRAEFTDTGRVAFAYTKK